ncbi:MAG TPA: peptidase [Gammaproteobacteria bacterium]|nr:peptidase [Gammaproteobacteria bacterium]
MKILCLFFSILLPNIGLDAATLRLPAATGITGFHKINIISMEEKKFENMVRQETDFSCGAAALATILRYGFRRQLSEADVVEGMYSVSDPEIVKKRGFSLLEMKKYLSKVGLLGRGYIVSDHKLHQLKRPAIVLMEINNYIHFVVIKKVINNTFYIADPSLGNLEMDLPTFKKLWFNNIVFTILGDGYDHDTILVKMTANPLLPNQTLKDMPLPATENLDYGLSHGVLF